MTTKRNSKAVLKPAFCLILRGWRRRSGLTQVKAAMLLGTPLGSYLNWEQGRYEPATFAKKKILEIISKQVAGQ